jgi:hypothetical protein
MPQDFQQCIYYFTFTFFDWQRRTKPSFLRIYQMKVYVINTESFRFMQSFLLVLLCILTNKHFGGRIHLLTVHCIWPFNGLSKFFSNPLRMPTYQCTFSFLRTLMLFPVGWLCCTFHFWAGNGVGLGKKDYRKNLPLLVWWNSCTSHLSTVLHLELLCHCF